MKNFRFSRNSFLILLLSAGNLLYSQGGTTTIDTKISTWTTTLKRSLNAGVSAFAIVGAFLIFIQYMQGSEQAQKNFIRFVIGLAIFGLVDVIVQVFL